MKPILFNSEMVRAILDGRKAVTRRVVKPPYFVDVKGEPMTMRPAPKGSYVYRKVGAMPYPESLCKVGDILWVRETWCAMRCADCGVNDDPYSEADCYIDRNGLTISCDDGLYIYKATDCLPKGYKWHPSIHMPREAARLFLRVTGVRVERLQEIDKHWDNYKREGVVPPNSVVPNSSWYERFIHLWNSMVKVEDRCRYGWDANPWVLVIEFERCEKPEGGASDV